MGPKKGRPCCTIQVDDLREILFSHLGQITSESFAGACYAAVHAKHSTFFKALLSVTRALTRDVAVDALPARLDKDTEKMIASDICNAFSDLLAKHRSFLRKGAIPKAQPAVYEDIFSTGLLTLEKTLDVQASSAARASPQSSPECGSEELECLDSSSSEAPGTGEPEVPSFLLGAPLPAASAAVSVIESSQESCVAVEAAANQVSYSALPAWWDSSAKKMRLQMPHSGNTVFGEVEPGPNGFLMVTWPDGSSQETEISNLAAAVQAGPVMKRPAARKRPAAAASAAASAEASDEASATEAPAPAAAEAPAPAEAVPAEAAPAEAAPGEAAPAEARAEDLQPRRRLRREGVEEPMYQDSPVFGAVRTYMGPEKAYIQYWVEDAGSWKSVVNFSKSASQNRHKEHLRAVWARLSEPYFGQWAVDDLKAELLASA